VFRRQFLFVTVPLAAICIAMLVYVNVLEHLPSDYEVGGHEFMVDGRGVDAVVLPFPRTVRRSDSFPVAFKLQPGPTGTPAGLANEANGTLTPSLTVAGCTVTPQSADVSKPTGQMIGNFFWQWTISGCNAAGVIVLQLLVHYDGHGVTSTPTAYRKTLYARVTDPFPLDAVLKVVGCLVGVVGAIPVILDLVRQPAKANAHGYSAHRRSRS
jgi:hypothetical protein